MLQDLHLGSQYLSYLEAKDKLQWIWNTSLEIDHLREAVYGLDAHCAEYIVMLILAQNYLAGRFITWIGVKSDPSATD